MRIIKFNVGLFERLKKEMCVNAIDTKKLALILQLRNLLRT